MRESRDEKTIEVVTNEIFQNNNTAIAMLVLALANFEGFKDEFEWSYALGRLFSVAMESQFHTRNTELLYNEAGEAILDEKIREMLGKCNAREKASIAGFLLAATKPTTQMEIDTFVGQKCSREIGIP